MSDSDTKYPAGTSVQPGPMTLFSQKHANHLT